MTARLLVGDAAGVLTAAGVPSPVADAESLLAHVLDLPRSALAGVDTVPTRVLRRFEDLVQLRASRVPLQHLTGRAGFRYLDLAVGPGVFIPRPESELLAGWAVESLVGRAAPQVADLGTGAGGLALSIAHEVPGCEVYAVELDPHALAWARRNAEERVAAGDRGIQLVEGDAGDPRVLAGCDGQLDAVLTNPPYVPDDAVVDREVAEHDPPLALWGGPDGLSVVRRFLARAATLLRPGGLLGVEHADLQGETMPALVAAHGAFAEIQDHRDLGGRPRFTTAVRR